VEITGQLINVMEQHHYS